MNQIILLFLEVLDALFPFHQHCKCRCLHPTYNQPMVIQHRKQSGGINSYQPVCFTSRHRRIIKIIIFMSIFHLLKSFQNCFFLHGRNPQSFKGKFTFCLVIYQTENQLPFSSCICCTYNFCDICSVKQFL